MSLLTSRWLVPALLLIASPWAAASPRSTDGGKAPRPNPLDATVAVPPAVHESAFAGYRGHGETQLQSWKGANDEVARIGGWRSYAREATQSSGAREPAAANDATQAPSKPKHQGHGDHKTH